MGKIKVDDFIKRKKMIGLDITHRHINELKKVLLVFDSNSIKNRINSIYNFIKYDVDGDWVLRLEKIKNELKNDSSSLKSFKIRYGDKFGEELFNEKCKKTRIDKNHFIKKHGLIRGEEKWLEYKEISKTPWGLDACVKKYGEKVGKIKWDERLSRKINTQNERKKIKPYKNGRTLKEYQNRYGLINGERLWKLRNNRQRYRFSINYFIETYGEVSGTSMYSNYRASMDKTSLKSFISRYGEKVGNERYDKFISKIKYSSTIQYYIEKYGEIDGINRYDEMIIKKIINFPGYSKISQKLFWGVFDGNKGLGEMYFAELNKEYMFYVHEKWCKVFSVDFKCGNKIIEFDGDYWHSSDKQKSIDKMRDSFLRERGYSILRITEMEFNNNNEKTINKCLKFLKNE